MNDVHTRFRERSLIVVDKSGDVEDTNITDGVNPEVEDLLEQFINTYDTALRNLADK